jgi:A/G-specific adenine glycosylase
LAWYARHARDLPWRRSSEPYAVWISEVMLQQTQVATVRSYFERFLAAFPTVEALAAADEQAVLRLWEGLGYYRRAKQLRRAAQVLVAEHGGQFPRDAAALRRLPGIGRYTAGAILSIAFDLPEPILEANTVRVWSRLLGYRGDPTPAAGQRLLWDAAAAVLPRRGAGRLNQALMELGSQICLARGPRCDECPAATLCRASQEGTQAEIPRAKQKTHYTELHHATAIIRRKGRVLLVQCPDDGQWAGLWDFPRFRVFAEAESQQRRELIDNLRRLTGVVVRLGEPLRTIRHSVTRYRITLDCYAAEFVSSDGRAPQGIKIRWLSPAELAHLPLTSSGRRLAVLAEYEKG